MKRVAYFVLVYVMVSTLFFSCKKDNGNDTPTTGTLKGKVTNSASAGIANIRIIVYDANTNAPIGNVVKTGSDGTYKLTIDPGTYYLVLSGQGYNSIPAAGVSPIAISVEVGKETVADYQMESNPVTDGGFISGKITADGKTLPGVMIIATDTVKKVAFSSVSGTDGLYYIYNVPAGTAYRLQGFLSGYNSTKLSKVTVTANTETSGKDLALSTGKMGILAGQVQFLSSTGSPEVDVELIDPITRQTIPGLSTMTVNHNFKISKIPNGTYILRASFANDGNVVDPDWLVKFGEPVVTFSGDSISKSFAVTGAIHLSKPTNDSISTAPVTIKDTIPTFTWVAYPSTSNYIIEVSDFNGKVIWGGFTNTNGSISRNISIPSNQLSIKFNSDGKASIPSLKNKTVYRWRIYASKNDVSALGWHLISMSEDQRGLIKVDY